MCRQGLGQAGVVSLLKRDSRKLYQGGSEPRLDLERVLQCRGGAAQLVPPQEGLHAGNRPKRRIADILLGQREAIPRVGPRRLEFHGPFELAGRIVVVAAAPEFTNAQCEETELEVQQRTIPLDLGGGNLLLLEPEQHHRVTLRGQRSAPRLQARGTARRRGLPLQRHREAQGNAEHDADCRNAHSVAAS